MVRYSFVVEDFHLLHYAGFNRRSLSGTTVYNNHYFLDPDHRRIMTHKVLDGRTQVFQIQEFVRVARVAG